LICAFSEELEKSIYFTATQARRAVAQAEAAREGSVFPRDISYKLAKYGLRTSPDELGFSSGV